LRQRALLLGRQEVPRPIERRAQGRRAPLAAAEQIQVLAQAIEQLLRAEHAHARAGELDRQGQTVEPGHELGDDRALVGARSEIRARKSSSIQEKSHGIRLEPGLDAGQDQASELRDDFAAHAQSNTRRNQHAELGSAPEPVLDGRHGDRNELLEIVEHEQRGTAGDQRIHQARRRVVLRALLPERNTERPGHGTEDAVQVRRFREVAEPHTARAARQERAAVAQPVLDRESSLARTRRAEHRHQAGVPQVLVQVQEIIFTTDETRRWCREVGLALGAGHVADP
jgi:hypothetical protein